jgi:hypothetical protein
LFQLVCLFSSFCLRFSSQLKKKINDDFFADNRSWTNPQSKSEFGCIGLDYVKDAKLLDIRYYWNETHQVLRGTATFPSCCEGPPGTIKICSKIQFVHVSAIDVVCHIPACAHGASIATVFDEILAHPVWRVRPQAFTVQLNVQYRKMVPLGSTQCFEARVDFDRLLPADLESNDPATARAARQVFIFYFYFCFQLFVFCIFSLFATCTLINSSY